MNLMSEFELLSTAWRDAILDSVGLDHLRILSETIHHERKQGTVYPCEGDVFQALDLSPLDQTRVVILGQDPYHGEGQAHGLSFSVRKGIKLPPSLRNIYRELESDLGMSPQVNGQLSSWAQQGVLLLNTVLTVRKGEAHSHRKLGWEKVTDAVISAVSRTQPHVVFILWGRPAQLKAQLIDQRHTCIQSVHPSPLSAYRGFFGSAPFSKTNQALKAHGQLPIDWSLSPSV